MTFFPALFWSSVLAVSDTNMLKSIISVVRTVVIFDILLFYQSFFEWFLCLCSRCVFSLVGKWSLSIDMSTTTQLKGFRTNKNVGSQFRHHPSWFAAPISKIWSWIDLWKQQSVYLQTQLMCFILMQISRKHQSCFLLLESLVSEQVIPDNNADDKLETVGEYQLQSGWQRAEEELVPDQMVSLWDFGWQCVWQNKTYRFWDVTS